MPKIIERLLLLIASPVGYKTLFKGAMALFGLYLVTMGQAIPVAYDKEREAFASKTTIESKFNFQINVDNVDCRTLKTDQRECLIAQYESKTVASSVNFLLTLLKVFAALGTLLGTLSFAGFISSLAFDGEQQKTV